MKKITLGLANKKSWPLWTGALGLILYAALTPPQTAETASVLVDASGNCTFTDAITAANRDENINGCTYEGAPAISDIIILATNVTGTPPVSGIPPVSGTPPISGAFPIIYTNMTIEGNNHTIDANETGRVIYNTAELTINDVIITGGNAEKGGGIYNEPSGNLKLNRSTVNSNNAMYGGGMYSFGTITINNSTISGNNVWFSGGGIHVEQGTASINYSTISGNTADWAGGINNWGAITLAHSLISGNSAGGSANEIGNNGTIVADYNMLGHSGATNAEAFSGGFTPGGFNITGTVDGTHPTALPVILNTHLANNGGPTMTHALVPGSPAIDLIPSGTSPCGVAPFDQDQRGFIRPVGQGCDAGAYEFGSTTSGFLPSVYLLLLLQSTPPTT